ncbi:MAG: 2-isopropylmalate synthase [Glaciecola sp.]|jgi:2-isopropylmalate synthase
MGNPLDVAQATTAINDAGFGADVIIFDTTLRDGEQSPGISLDAHEKVEIASQLARLKVDVIEAGFSAASPGDFDAVKAVAEIVGNDDSHGRPPVIASLARALPGDIEAAAKSLAPAARRRIHTFLSTSDIHRRYMLEASEDEILAQAVRAVELAKSYTDDVEFSPQDATRTDFDFLVDMTAAVVEAGATTVNIPDTVGYALPHDFGNWIKLLHERVPAIAAKGVIISVHCHNDLGLAVANSLEAVRNGARQVEVAVNGLGERAGNCSLEEIAMAIRTRADIMGVNHSLDTREITRTSRMVSHMTGYAVQKNKAVVGENAFAHESGIHQHGVLQDRQTYEIMKSEEVGASGSQIVLGKHSGRHAFFQALDDLDYNLTDDERQRAFARFKAVADRKGLVGTEDLEAIVNVSASAPVDDDFELVSFQVASGTDLPPTAKVTLRRVGGNDEVSGSGEGDGMVDAACRAIRDAIDRPEVTLTSFHVGAVGSGIDALGEVTVQIKVNGDQTFSGRGVATDIVEASARAYVDALNRSRRIVHRTTEFKP